MDKKNLIIVVLIGLLVFGSLWGQVGNKNSKALRHELEQAENQLAMVETANNQTHEAVLTKTADLQKTLQEKERQVTKARNELVALRKANKGLEAKLSERDAAVQKLVSEKKNAAAVDAVDPGKVASLEKQVVALQEELKKAQQAPKDKAVAGTTDQTQELQRERDTLQAELKAKDEQLAHFKASAASQASAQETITELRNELSTVHAELKQKGESDGNTAKVEALKKSLVDAQAELEKREESIAVLKNIQANQVEGLEKKIAALEGKLKEQTAQPVLRKFVRIQGDGDAEKDKLNKKIATLQAELKQKDEQIAQVQADGANLVASLQQKLAVLKDDLQEKDKQLAQSQESKIPEEVISQLQEKNAALQAAMKKKNEQFEMAESICSAQVAELKTKITELMKELTSRDETAERHELAAVKAQLIGLQKIVEEKDTVNDEISRTLDRANTNMDVLLNKIADQQTAIQELEEANRGLVKDLTAKNEEVDRLRNSVQPVPAQ